MKAISKTPVFWLCISLLLLSGCKNSMVGKAYNNCVTSIVGAYYLEKANGLYDEGQKPAALELYTKAAADGHAEAQYIVSHMLLYGDGVPMNRKAGLDWLEKSAAKGHIDSLRALGTYYYSGDLGLSRDADRSRTLLEQAAAQDDGYAMMMLGYMYQTGYGMARNPEEAASWYRRASAAGFPVPAVLMDAKALSEAKPRRYNPKADQQARVKRAQACLKALGYYKGAVDGIPGRGTQSAVKKFQKDRHVEADGKIDLVLMRHIHDRIFNDPLRKNL